jgi:hypothetical protein
MSDLTTMEGVPVDRRRASFVCSNGCEETKTLGGAGPLIAWENGGLKQVPER